jgi:AcrR family transcriptional regulator
MSGMAKTEVDAASLPETPRPRGRPRAADRGPLILEAANQLLDEVGYDHLRVQDVADRARVGLATIYRRWPTKQALVIAAMRRAKAEVVRPETDDPRADLEAYFREMANQILGPKSCFVVGFVTALRNDPELARRVDIAPAFLIFRTLIDDRAVDPDELALRLCALVVGSVTH